MRSLIGPRLKLARADDQIRTLKSEIQRALDSKEHPLTLELKSEAYLGDPAITLFAPSIPTIPEETGVLLG